MLHIAKLIDFKKWVGRSRVHLPCHFTILGPDVVAHFHHQIIPDFFKLLDKGDARYRDALKNHQTLQHLEEQVK